MNNQISKFTLIVIVVLVIIGILTFHADENYIRKDQNVNLSVENVAQSGPVDIQSDETYKNFSFKIKGIQSIKNDSNNEIDIDELYRNTKSYILKNVLGRYNEIEYQNIDKKSDGSYSIYFKCINNAITETLEVQISDEKDYSFNFITIEE